MAYFGCGVMRCAIPDLVTQEHLPIFPVDPDTSEPVAVGVLHVVNADGLKSFWTFTSKLVLISERCPSSRTFPTRVVYLGDRISFKRKDKFRMRPAAALDHGSSNPIKNHIAIKV